MPISPAPTVADEPLIALDHASVMRGGAVVLDDLTLSIASGQHTAVLGPNGCGKSTFIKLITRELYPLARNGQAPVRVFGRTHWRVHELRRHLGVVTGGMDADLASMPGLTVEQAVLSGFFATPVLPPDAVVAPAMRQAAHEALARMDATALAGRLYAELSTGQARRVLIARALAPRPSALLLDEPTAGLDAVARQRLLALLEDLARQVTLVLVTHHIEEIIPAIGRVVLLRQGRVLADGETHTVLTDAHLSAAYAGEVKVRRERDRYHLIAR